MIVLKSLTQFKSKGSIGQIESFVDLYLDKSHVDKDVLEVTEDVVILSKHQLRRALFGTLVPLASLINDYLTRASDAGSIKQFADNLDMIRKEVDFDLYIDQLNDERLINAHCSDGRPDGRTEED